MIDRIVFSFLAAMLAVSASAIELSDTQRTAIEERIKPVGESCLEGEGQCGGVMAAAPAVTAGAARSGEDVYNAACMACHSTGAAGAPKLGDTAAWSPRIAKGMDALYESGVNGLAGTGMMAKGGCVSCTDEEVGAAVDHMVAGSQ